MDVDTYMKAHRASGVIVLKNGEVLLERYGLGRTADDVWLAQSVGKTVTAFLVGAAIQDGYIRSMDDLVADYIPQLKGGAYDGVTIRQLLTMTSGVKFDEDYVNPDGDGSQIWVWPFAKEDPAAYLGRLPRADRPGAKFVYNNGDAFLAGILVSKATGKYLSAYLAEKLWKPFGMEKPAYWVVSPYGLEGGDGTLSMTLRDYARFGQFMLDGGKSNGVQVVPLGWVADATRAQVTLPSEFEDENGATDYGYYWWIYKDAYAARGHAGQAIYVYPEDNVVIAVNSAWPESEKARDHWQALYAFVQALHAAAVVHR
ncbi:serine hydrolase [Mesorhizobium sp. M0800]|uniref:serine hydrolase domain-containing protein n=1 Tax=Mesorhizobium sp. M0800 TaxID=2957000 RepID=UPI00333AAFA4